MARHQPTTPPDWPQRREKWQDAVFGAVFILLLSSPAGAQGLTGEIRNEQWGLTFTVTGVYATKPGVLLTERGIGEDLGDTVPMGVIGVIRTKVSAENGPIRRGDLLVTANLEGHAMKGTDRSRMLGAVLGKALENFDGPGTGMIEVMVNVK